MKCIHCKKQGPENAITPEGDHYKALWFTIYTKNKGVCQNCKNKIRD